MGSKYIVVTIKVEQEGDQFTAEALELGVASCGDTDEEARDNIVEAVDLYLSAIASNGTRERVFREKGIVVQQGEPKAEPKARENAQDQRVPVLVA